MYLFIPCASNFEKNVYLDSDKLLQNLKETYLKSIFPIGLAKPEINPNRNF